MDGGQQQKVPAHKSGKLRMQHLFTMTYDDDDDDVVLLCRKRVNACTHTTQTTRTRQIALVRTKTYFQLLIRDKRMHSTVT